jgi:hypothetical protein
MAAILYFAKDIPRLQQNRSARGWDRFLMKEIRGHGWSCGTREHLSHCCQEGQGARDEGFRDQETGGIARRG